MAKKVAKMDANFWANKKRKSTTFGGKKYKTRKPYRGQGR